MKIKRLDTCSRLIVSLPVEGAWASTEKLLNHQLISDLDYERVKRTISRMKRDGIVQVARPARLGGKKVIRLTTIGQSRALNIARENQSISRSESLTGAQHIIAPILVSGMLAACSTPLHQRQSPRMISPSNILSEGNRSASCLQAGTREPKSRDEAGQLIQIVDNNESVVQPPRFACGPFALREKEAFSAATMVRPEQPVILDVSKTRSQMNLGPIDASQGTSKWVGPPLGRVSHAAPTAEIEYGKHSFQTNHTVLRQAVFFHSGSSEVGRQVIVITKTAPKTEKNVKIRITAGTDPIGSLSSNRSLASTRASRVAIELAKLGFTKDQIEVKLVPNNVAPIGELTEPQFVPDSVYAIARRVEIEFIV